MPCYLCETRIERLQDEPTFKTPLMPKAIPFFNGSNDYLCRKCYLVYIEEIEFKYGPSIRMKYGMDMSDFEMCSEPPPPTPPESESVLNYTAYSSRYAPKHVMCSYMAAVSDVWTFEILGDVDLDDLPFLPPRDRRPRDYSPPYWPARGLPIPSPSFAPIDADASISIDFPVAESKAYLNRQRHRQRQRQKKF